MMPRPRVCLIVCAGVFLLHGCGKSSPPVGDGPGAPQVMERKSFSPPETPREQPPPITPDPVKVVTDPVKTDPPPATADYQRLLAQGREAMKVKQYAEAVRVFEQALLLMPGDAPATQALADARAALNADQAEKKKLADYEERLKAGKAALAAGRYADALQEFLAAQRLIPGDAAAAQGVREAEQQLAALQDIEKRKSEYTRLMAQAGAALKNQRYDEAIRAYTAAEKLMPGDKDALQGLRDARQAAAGDTKAAYAQSLQLAEAAYRAQRLADAIQAYQDALRFMPNDPVALRGLRQAEQAMIDSRARLADYEKAMKSGAAALKQKRFAEAARDFAEALRLFPGDAPATAGLRDVRFAQHMADGEAAMRGKKFAEAIRAYEEALKEMPGDRTALADLQQAKNAVGNTTDRARADYEKAMKEGNQALKQKKFADAVDDFEAALKAKPNDPAALQGLQQAKAGKELTTEYDKQIKAGQAAMKTKKYADAVKAFELALKALPGDKEATALLAKAKTAMK